MDLKQIESFVSVAELGSFTRAAAALGIAQPLLSRQVRQLELEFRQTFLLRNGRGVTLTEAGLVLLEHGRGILHQVALAREELGSIRGALAGRVSVGLPPSLSRMITVPLTQAFQRELPLARLSLTEGFSALMFEALRNGRLDLAVLYNPPTSPELETALLHQEALVLISATTRAAEQPARALPATVSLRDLAALPLIVPSRPNAFRLLIESGMARLGCKPDIVLEIDGLSAILDLVRDGLGYAVLPAYTLSNFARPHPFVTHAIEQPTLISQLNLVWSARRPTTETHKQALAIVRRTVMQAVLRLD